MHPQTHGHTHTPALATLHTFTQGQAHADILADCNLDRWILPYNERKTDRHIARARQTQVAGCGQNDVPVEDKPQGGGGGGGDGVYLKSSLRRGLSLRPLSALDEGGGGYGGYRPTALPGLHGCAAGRAGISRRTAGTKVGGGARSAWVGLVRRQFAALR